MTETNSNNAGLSAPEETKSSRGDAQTSKNPRILNIPNQITIGRLLLSVVIFVILVIDNYKLLDANRNLWLNISLVLFVLAAATDFLDGYLARKWNMLSSFGRIADPIVDKVFICGSFVLLVKTCTLIAPWIPVVIITREFLVSGLRGFLEGRGLPFGAGSMGKLKMLSQSITIPLVLFYEANLPESVSMKNLIIVLLALTILLTVGSCAQYIVRARRLLREERIRDDS